MEKKMPLLLKTICFFKVLFCFIFSCLKSYWDKTECCCVYLFRYTSSMYKREWGFILKKAVNVTLESKLIVKPMTAIYQKCPRSEVQNKIWKKYS